MYPSCIVSKSAKSRHTNSIRCKLSCPYCCQWFCISFHIVHERCLLAVLGRISQVDLWVPLECCAACASTVDTDIKYWYPATSVRIKVSMWSQHLAFLNLRWFQRFKDSSIWKVSHGLNPLFRCSPIYTSGLPVEVMLRSFQWTLVAPQWRFGRDGTCLACPICWDIKTQQITITAGSGLFTAVKIIDHCSNFWMICPE